MGGGEKGEAFSVLFILLLLVCEMFGRHSLPRMCTKKKMHMFIILTIKRRTTAVVLILNDNLFITNSVFVFCSSQEIAAESDFTSRKDFCFEKLSKDAWNLPSLPKECLFCRGKTGFG